MYSHIHVYFIRVSEEPAQLKVKCTLVSTYQELPINYRWESGGGFFHLDDAEPQVSYELIHDSYVVGVFLFRNSTGSCVMIIQETNTSYLISSGKLSKIKLQVPENIIYSLSLSLNEEGTDVYGFLCIINLSFYAQYSTQQVSFALLPFLIGCGFLWYKKKYQKSHHDRD